MFDDFTGPLDQRWTQTCMGGGTLDLAHSALRMAFETARQGQYPGAQIDDYAKLSRANFPWRPPLRMQVRARSSLAAATLRVSERAAILHVTAGFVFLNYPLSLGG